MQLSSVTDGSLPLNLHSFIHSFIVLSR